LSTKLYRNAELLLWIAIFKKYKVLLDIQYYKFGSRNIRQFEPVLEKVLGKDKEER